MIESQSRARFWASESRWRRAASELRATLRRWRRPSYDQRLRQFQRAGSVPWSDGYSIHRNRTIAATLADDQAMATFREAGRLASGFGHGLDERCVEVPWALSRITRQPGRILDAGSALNFAYLLDLPIWENKDLHIVTLAPEANCYWFRSISYLYEDLRDLPIRDEVYDQLVSISTLEHVGFDNREFAGDARHREFRPEDFRRAVGELARVLKVQGSALLTVPYGVPETLGGHQVFDRDGLAGLIDAFGPAECQVTYYRYDENGWQVSEPEACEDRRFVDWISRPPAARADSPFPQQPDGAAAARAVACLELTKTG